MWQAIGQVTSVLTLAAFSIATLAAVARAYLKGKERQLLAAPEDQRPALIQALNDSFLIHATILDTGIFPPDHAFKLLIEQIRDRSRRYYAGALLVAFIALLAAATTAYAYSNSRRPDPPAPPPDAARDSTAERASLAAILSVAYAVSGRLAIFLDGWMRPPAIETARVASGTLSFTGNQGEVSTSIDTSQLPIVVAPPDYVHHARLTPEQSSSVATFLTAYGQLKGALGRVGAVPPDGLRGALIDATSAAREAARRGVRAVCSLSDSLPTLIRAYPPRQDELSPCPHSARTRG